MMTSTSSLQLGLRPNLAQFSLLLLVNAFVGAMLGLERTLIPLIAEQDFGLTSVSVTLSFIISFGVVKALANLFAGRNADRWGRKPLLIAGWLIGLPVPFLVIGASDWGWVVFANILLGIQQGLCWSAAVMMKIDLVGAVGRGRATGLNEFAGYLAMALTTALAGGIAAQTTLRQPFYLGIGFAVMGLILTIFAVKETLGHARLEAAQRTAEAVPFGVIFRRVTYQDRRFFSLSQAGLVNNLNDVVIWGLMPLAVVGAGIPLERAAALGGTYLGVWGISQLFTGAMSDHTGRKPWITGGLAVQAAGILLMAFGAGEWTWFFAAALMGLGTGMVYPTLLAAMSDLAHPSWRASALGVYRLWRDSGYAFGALVGGILADLLNLPAAILVIGLLTIGASAITWVWLPETKA